MKKFYLASLLLVLVSPAIGQVVISNLASPYTQDFNSLASTGTSSTLPAGWLFFESGTGSPTTYAADNGASNSGNTYSYGTTGSTERAFGTLQSGTNIPTIGAYFSNTSGSTITSITIDYYGEQWRLGAASRADTLNFQYSTNATSLTAGTYIDVDALDFLTPNTIASSGALDGNATANRLQKVFTINGLSIASGTTFYFRWLDGNISGSDDGLGIDDFTITFNGASLPACTQPTAQPTGLIFAPSTNTSISGSFTAASPATDRYLVIISASNTLTASPQNGTTYSDDDGFGNGTVLATSSGTSFSATSLTAGTTYYIYIFSFNSNCTGGPLYNANQPLSGSVATTAPPVCVAPGAAPGAITTNAAGTSINGSFVAATGADGYLAIRSNNSSFTFAPVNGTSYSPGQTVGAGTVIKFSAGTTFAANGLTPNTTYYFFVYSVNNFNCTGGPLYNQTPSTANATTTANANGIPIGYYDTVTTQSCAALKSVLKWRTMQGMTPRSYGDLWAQYLVSDIKPREVVYPAPNNTANVIWDIYSDNPAGIDPYNFTPSVAGGLRMSCSGFNYGGESDCYNREHSVPQNWFGGNASAGSVGAVSDFHHILPTDGKVNGDRGNYLFGEVLTPNATSQNGSKRGTSAIGGFSPGTIVFEPLNEYKGDLARAFLYFVTRYEDNMTGYTGGIEGGQAFAQNTFPSVDIPYLQVMIKWHNQDPVSQKEIDRNNSGYTYQGNRNPYVDHPEYVALTWNNSCTGLSTLPVDIISFGGKLVGDKVMLEWMAENELNFDHFEIERSVNGTTYYKIGEVKAANLRNYSFSDDAVRGQRVYYRLKRVDKDARFKYSTVFSLHVPLNTKFTVYPNPANSFIQLQMNRNVTGKVAIQLTDISGKVLQQHTVAVNGNTIKLSTSSLSTGTYLVKLTYNGEQYIQKVMVVK